MITLASDFGSPYPAAMKGAILTRCDARLVDIGHEFPRQNVRAAAFWLSQILPEFPPAVHLVVVDPGVGTDRAALVVRAGDHVLVGPDNGVLLPPARALASAEGEYRDDIDAYEFEVDATRSATFHGRDVFAPGAAEVHETGIDRLPELEGLSPADEIVELELPEPELTKNEVTGEVIAVDDFGNVITNIPGEVLGNRTVVRVNDEPTPIVRSYGHVEPDRAIVTIGSHGNVECAVNRGRGDEAFDLDAGEPVRLEFA